MKTIPRLRFAHLPTSIEALPRLSAFLGGPALLVKRDDQTGLALGGNKTRKLEFLLAEAQAHGARTIITAGAIQSNHCRQTAAAAARFGMDCILVLFGDMPASPSGNLLLDELLGAEIVTSQSTQLELIIKDTFEAAWRNGRRPYLVPYGGSNPTGAAGYVYAMKELVDQCQAPSLKGSPPDWIVIPSSSGGTQAGMLVGSCLFGFTGKILGISIDKPAEELQEKVASLANATAEHLGEALTIKAGEVLINSDYLGGGYGVMGEPEREAMAIFARKEGLILDPVYTGRAAAGLIDLIRKEYFPEGDRLLFWHTGGAPALFAERYRNLS
jgi:D-cysteine desulfhydrase family pyridoxal phosphate-dependent enzyme